MAFWSIAKRELKSLFVSPVAYTVLGVFAFFVGIEFLSSLEQFDLALQQAQTQAQLARNPDALAGVNLNELLIGNVLIQTFFLLLIAIPLISMRFLTEERSRGTYELLLTSPLSTWEIVIGKFVAGAIFLFAILLTHLLFIGVMFGYGDPELLPVLSGYFGLYLAGCAFMAIGLFASSLSKNQLIAAIIAFAVNWVLVVTLSRAAFNAPENMGTFLKQTSITHHLQTFTQGLISLTSVVYFLTFCAFFLAATRVSMESLKRG